QDGIRAWHESLNELTKARVKLISQPKQGTSRARNAGIAQSSSPYVAFLDADDIWLPEKLERQIELMDAAPDVSLVYCWAAAIDEQGQLLGRIYAERLRQQAWAGLVERNVISTPSTVLLRRDCLEAVGGFDATLGSYVEDKDLWLRIALNHKMRLMPEVLIHKRRHGANTSKQWVAMEQASARVIDKAIAAAPGQFSPAQLRRLRQRSYAELKRNTAWKPLQTQQVEVVVALRYLLSAWRYRPVMMLSTESLKLMFVMMALTLVGPQQYRRALRRVARLRHWVSRAKMLSWMKPSFQRSSSL
ncbi:MAG: glycosyltransferase family 2 protein, partial [Cyanobacteria bacterium J06649_4]